MFDCYCRQLVTSFLFFMIQQCWGVVVHRCLSAISVEILNVPRAFLSHVSPMAHIKDNVIQSYAADYEAGCMGLKQFHALSIEVLPMADLYYTSASGYLGFEIMTSLLTGQKHQTIRYSLKSKWRVFY